MYNKLFADSVLAILSSDLVLEVVAHGKYITYIKWICAFGVKLICNYTLSWVCERTNIVT